MANVINANILNVGVVNYVRQWSNDATLTLIQRRQHYNDWFRTEENGPLWDRIARQIGTLNNLSVTGNQCKNKWNALKRGYENLKRILEGNPDGFPIYSANSYDQRFYGELSDEFWDNSRYQLALHRDVRVDRRCYEYREHRRSQRSSSRDRRRERERRRDRRRDRRRRDGY